MGIFESLFIGISIAAIPGPIFFELIRRTLTKGFWHGAFLVVGEFLGNLALLLLIFFGLSNFLENKILKITLYLIGGIILLFIGFNALKLKTKNIEKSYDKKISNSNSLLAGFSIAVTSPIVIALWISLSGSYLAQYNRLLALFNIGSIALGFLVFFVPLAMIVHLTRHKIPLNYVVNLSRIFGIILIVYGISFIYRFSNFVV